MLDCIMFKNIIQNKKISYNIFSERKSSLTLDKKITKMIALKEILRHMEPIKFPAG